MRHKSDMAFSDSHTGAKGSRVTVSVRVCPTVRVSSNRRDELNWIVDREKSTIVRRGQRGDGFHYGQLRFQTSTFSVKATYHVTDNVFDVDDDNIRVYTHAVKPLVERVMVGCHGTAFLYGMSDLEKTFLMQGTESSLGLRSLAIGNIFSYIRRTPLREYLLQVSYLEIHNGRVYDLLGRPARNETDTNTARKEIHLQHFRNGRIYAVPLTKETVQTPTQLVKVIARGDRVRRTANAKLKTNCSENLAIVQVSVDSQNRHTAANAIVGCSKQSRLAQTDLRVSTLNLIDLGASEETPVWNERTDENKLINRGLHALPCTVATMSRWLCKWSDTEKLEEQLPHRESKFTRLLQEALSGNGLVSLICTIEISGEGTIKSSRRQNAETLKTLRLALGAQSNFSTTQ